MPKLDADIAKCETHEIPVDPMLVSCYNDTVGKLLPYPPLTGHPIQRLQG